MRRTFVSSYLKIICIIFSSESCCTKRIYSHKKNQYRMACVRTINGYRNRLKRLAIKQWIVYWKLVRKFRKVIFIVIKRHSLLRWKKVVRKKIKYEATLAKIILNRWNLLAAAASERRSLNLMALNHWACHSCRVVLKSWLSIADPRFLRDQTSDSCFEWLDLRRLLKDYL